MTNYNLLKCFTILKHFDISIFCFHSSILIDNFSYSLLCRFRLFSVVGLLLVLCIQSDSVERRTLSKTRVVTADRQRMLYHASDPEYCITKFIYLNRRSDTKNTDTDEGKNAEYQPNNGSTPSFYSTTYILKLELLVNLLIPCSITTGVVHLYIFIFIICTQNKLIENKYNTTIITKDAWIIWTISYSIDTSKHMYTLLNMS